MTRDEFIAMLNKYPQLWDEFEKLLDFYSSSSSKNTDSDRT